VAALARLVSVVPDNVIWGEDSATGQWFTDPPAGFALANPQPTVNNGTPATETLSINTVGNQTVNIAFAVTGTIGNVGTAPTLQYEDLVNGVAVGSWAAFPTGSSVTSTTFSLSHPAVTTAAGTFAVSVRDASTTTITATSNNFAIVGCTTLPAGAMSCPFTIAVNSTGVLPPGNTFSDQFTSLSLHDHWQTGDKWGPVVTTTDQGRGGVPNFGEGGDQWWTNPFNPSTVPPGGTPPAPLYQINPSGTLQLELTNIPRQCRLTSTVPVGAAIWPISGRC
jgi:hypothetical protein